MATPGWRIEVAPRNTIGKGVHFTYQDSASVLSFLSDCAKRRPGKLMRILPPAETDVAILSKVIAAGGIIVSRPI